MRVNLVKPYIISIAVALGLSFFYLKSAAHALESKGIRFHYPTKESGTKLRHKKPSKVRIVRVKRTLRRGGFVSKSELFGAPEGLQHGEEVTADAQGSPRGGGVMGGSNCRSNCNDTCRDVYGNNGGRCERIWFWTWATGVYSCECH